MSFHQTALANGLQVIAELDDRAHSVAAGFFVRTGSRDEGTEVSGVSHFLEHMVFKGTERRDALAVNRDLDRVGAKHNAQTSEEDTVYHVTCLPEYLEPSLGVLADILRPSLRAEDFETEKQVILEEIQMYLDEPISVAFEAAKAAHFGPHPLGRSILGSLESIGALSLEQMQRYYADRYGPANIVLAFAGKSDWAGLVALAGRLCGGWGGPAAPRVVLPSKGTGAFRAILRPEDSQQTVIAVADAPSLESPDRYAAQVLATALGDHTGSRLYWELIDPGRADGAELSYQDYNGAGAFFTFLSCEPDLVQDDLGRIAGLFDRAMADGLTDAEIARAQSKLMARTVLRGERPMGRLMSLGFHWTYRREYLPVQAELDAFAAVTGADVRRVLDRWPLRPMTVVSVGPTDDVHPPD